MLRFLKHYYITKENERCQKDCYRLRPLSVERCKINICNPFLHSIGTWGQIKIQYLLRISSFWENCLENNIYPPPNILLVKFNQKKGGRERLSPVPKNLWQHGYYSNSISMAVHWLLPNNFIKILSKITSYSSWTYTQPLKK